MWFTRHLCPKIFIPQTELPYNFMHCLEESFEEKSETLTQRFFKAARTERSSCLWSQLGVIPKPWYPEAKFRLTAASEKQSD